MDEVPSHRSAPSGWGARTRSFPMPEVLEAFVPLQPLYSDSRFLGRRPWLCVYICVCLYVYIYERERERNISRGQRAVTFCRSDLDSRVEAPKSILR